MKHAFLIIAHNEFEVLQRLISALDSERVDFYVHIDKKVKALPELHAEKAGLTMLKDRIDVRWGHVSQIECEYKLFEAALRKGEYCFYHLISGVHMPLKSVGEVLGYYDSMAGRNILPHLGCNSDYQKTLKVQRYNFGMQWFEYGPRWRRRLCQLCWRASNNLQRVLGIKRNAGVDLQVSSNWVSLSEDAVAYLIAARDEVMKIFRNTMCGDEWFVATELLSSPLKDTVVSPEGILLCSIGDSNARAFTEADYDDIIKSGCLWGRKFIGSQMALIDKLLNR